MGPNLKKAAGALALVFGIVTAGGAFAGEQTITAENPWARASIGAAKAGAAYLTLTNHGGEADSLVAVESDAAARSEVHGHSMQDGVMKMHPVGAVELAPGAPVTFAPGGLHVMLMGLNAPLTEGEEITLTLEFKESPPLTVSVPILAPAAMGPMGGHGREHGHGHGAPDS